MQEDIIIIGYKFDVTGACGYRYFQGGRCICNTSVEVVPPFPVHVNGFGMCWVKGSYSNDLWSLNDVETGEIVATYRKMSSYNYSINGKILVECAETKQAYIFKRKDDIIATFYRIDETDKRNYSTDKGSLLSLDYGIRMDDSLSVEEKLMILAFPLFKR